MTSLSDADRIARSYNDFVAILVHDLRTPLSSIMLNLEMLEGEVTALGDRAVEDLALAARATRQLSERLSTICAICMLEAREVTWSPEDVDLVPLTRSVLSDVVSDTATTVTIRVDGEARASCDPAMTREVVRELVRSANDAMPGGGRIVVGLSARGPMARVEVIDQATRVPPELRRLLFDRDGFLEVRKNHRTHCRGLGLVFCKLAIEAQGGTVGISSGEAPDHANTLWFELPRPGATRM